MIPKIDCLPDCYLESVRIIQIIDDTEFAKSRSHLGFVDKAFLFWGLGADSKLYFIGQFSGYGYATGGWRKYGEWPNNPGFSIPFSKMKELVKAFSMEEQ